MKSSRFFGFFFTVVLGLFHVFSPVPSNAAAPRIETLNGGHATIVEGDQLEILGRHFGIWTKKSSVTFEIQGKTRAAEIAVWAEGRIVVRVPLFPLIHQIALGEKIRVAVIEGDKRTRGEQETSFRIFNRKPLLDVIELKKRGFSDKFILDHFDKMTSEKTLKGAGFNGIELIRLKTVGFNDDVIASLARHRQYLSIGVAGIWLKETKDLVTSPVLRIFLSPRSYFDRREPFWSLSLGRQKEKFDFNIGYTTKTATSENGSEEKSYLLVGFSFELNRSALFNFGYALVPGDTEGRQTQPYFGITVDANILKDLGIMSKG